MLSFSGGTGVAGAYRQWVAEKERDREKDQARLPGAWTAATPARTPAKREKDAFFDRKRATRGDAGGGPAGRLQRENGTRGAEDGESGGERRSFAALDSLKREFETVLNSVAGSPATRTPGARTQTPRARVATGYAETPRSRSINSRLRSRSPRNATREMNQRLDDLIAKAEDLKNRFQSPVPAHGPQFGFGAADNNLEYYTPVKPSGAAQPTARSDPFEVLLSPEHDEDLFADFAFNPTSLPPRPNVPNSFFSPNYNSPMIIPERRDRDADRFRSPTNSASSKTSPSVPAQTPLHLPGAFPPTPYVAPRPQVDRPKDTPLKASVPGAFPESPYPYSARKPKTPATSAKLTSPSSSLTSPTDRLRGGNHSPLISPTDRARPADSRKVRFRSTVSEKTISWASPSVASPWSSVSGSWEPSPDFDRYGSELDEEEEQEDPIDRFVNEVGRIGGLVGDEKEEQVERERFDDADGFMDRMGDEDGALSSTVPYYTTLLADKKDTNRPFLPFSDR